MPEFVNYNNEDINFAAISAIKVEDEVIAAEATTDQVALKSGDNVELIPDPTNKEIVIKATLPETHPATMIVEDETHRFVTDEQITTWNTAAAGGVTVDDALSITSENPVQNKVVTAAINTNTDAIAAIKEGATITTFKGIEESLSGKANDTHTHTLEELGAAASVHTHAISDVTDLQTTLNAKVPTSRTVNGKALTEDITLSASDINADESGAASTAEANAKSYTDTAIANLVDSAPETMNTLNELATAISEHKEVTDALDAAIGNKANASDLTTHTGNTTVHITADERAAWNAKASTDVATLTSNGLMSKEDKTKLSSLILPSYDLEVDSMQIGTVNLELIKDGLTATTIPIVAGTGISVDSSSSGGKINISSTVTNTTYGMNITSQGSNGVNLNLVPSSGDTISIPIVGAEGTTVNGTSDGGFLISCQDTVFSDTAPLVAGTASAGTSTAASRSDHIHPAQTSVTGNAGTATALETARTINGMNFDGTANRYNYGSCSTTGSTAAKTVSCTGFVLATGAEITVRFSYTNTAENATLNVNSTGDKTIRYKGASVPANLIKGTGVYTFRYTGSVYDIVGEPEFDYWFTTTETSEGVQDRATNTVDGFSLYTGCEVVVTFAKTVTHTSARLNVSSTGAKYMYHKGAYIKPYMLQAGHTYTFRYDGSYWQLLGSFFENIGGDIVSRTSASEVITLDNKSSSSTASLIGFKKNGSNWGSLGFTSAGTLERFTTSGSSFKIHDAKSIQAGSITLTPTEANTTCNATVTFPTAFSSTPKVFACVDSTAPSTTVKGVTVYSPSTTSVKIYLNRSNTTATTIYWLAVEY